MGYTGDGTGIAAYAVACARASQSLMTKIGTTYDPVQKKPPSSTFVLDRDALGARDATVAGLLEIARAAKPRCAGSIRSSRPTATGSLREFAGDALPIVRAICERKPSPCPRFRSRKIAQSSSGVLSRRR